MLPGKTINRIWQYTLNFCRRYRWLVILFILTLILDTATTVNFMTETGPEEEFNPVVRLLSIHFGIIAGPIIGAFYKLTAAVLLVYIWEKFAGYVLAFACLSYSFAAWYNLCATELYDQNIVTWLPF